MNDPTVLEASRVLSENLLAQNPPAQTTPDNNLLTTAFRTIVCRRPSPKELSVLTDYYHEQLATILRQKSSTR